MWLVKCNTLTKIRPIAPEIKHILSRYFIENENISGLQKKEALALLQEAKENKYWLACDCITTTQEPPLMYVRRTQNNILSLVRMPSRTPHLDKCPFRFTQEQKTIATNSSSRSQAWDKKSPLLLHRDYATKLASNKTTQTETTRHAYTQKIPTLGRLLYSLIEDAGLNHYNQTSLKRVDQLKLLEKAANPYQLDSGISMANYFWHSPKQVAYARDKLKSIKVKWPKARPYGVFTVVVERFENKIAHCVHANGPEEILLEGNLDFSSGRLTNQSGPFLLLFTLTDLIDNKKSYYPMNGFAVPIHSANLLMPAESHYERLTLNKLNQLAYSLRKKDVVITIEKPLFDLKDNEGNPIPDCRPDFLLKTRQKCVVIEVMGSHEDDYLARKTRTHSLMEQVGQLVPFDAFEADKFNQWEKKLNDLCKALYKIFLSNK